MSFQLDTDEVEDMELVMLEDYDDQGGRGTSGLNLDPTFMPQNDLNILNDDFEFGHFIEPQNATVASVSLPASNSSTSNNCNLLQDTTLYLTNIGKKFSKTKFFTNFKDICLDYKGTFSTISKSNRNLTLVPCHEANDRTAYIEKGRLIFEFELDNSKSVKKRCVDYDFDRKNLFLRNCAQITKTFALTKFSKNEKYLSFDNGVFIEISLFNSLPVLALVQENLEN